MLSGLRDLLRRTVSARLTAWYCGFFVLSALTLFYLVDFSLESTLRKSDRAIIHAKLKELAGEYHEDGIRELRKVILEKHGNGFFVRVADGTNHTLFAAAPDSSNFGAKTLEMSEHERPTVDRWTIFEIPGEPGMELMNMQMGDGNFLQVGHDTQHRQAFLNHFRGVCAAVILPVILLALIGGALIGQRVLAPIRQLNDAVRAIIDTGKMDARISPRKTADELRELVVSFNQMLERIDALIKGMRNVLDNVAHDLRTPLARLRGHAEMALQYPRDVKTAQEALADCIEESERVITMLNTLMDISEAETGAMRLDLKKVSVGAIVAQVADLYRDVAEEKQVHLSVAATDDWPALADESRLRQAIANLLDNAVKYTPAGGEVKIESHRANGSIIIDVRDSGIGIPREDMPHVWERLYRGDKSRSQRGLGLGLSLVKAIAQAHAGRCEVESTPGAGSLFSLHVPAA